MKYLDNLNHELNIDDLVFCLTGSNAKTISSVVKLGTRKNEPFDDLASVTLENKKTLMASNVINLSKLGVTSDSIEWDYIGKEKHDALGHEIKVGDKILFLHRMECDSQTGTVKKLTAVTMLLEIPKNRFDQTEYRQKYGEVINLSAIGLGNVQVQLNYCDNGDRLITD